MPFGLSFVMLIAVAASLMGCDSPSIAFQRVEATRVQVAGSTYSVRHTRYEAEAIGIGFQPGATRRANVIKGVAAIENVTGCPVVIKSVRGDANIVAADLNCAGVPKRIRRAKPAFLNCTGSEVGGLSGDQLQIDCAFVQ